MSAVKKPPAAAPVPVTLRLRALHAPKEGNAEDEYEDAFAFQKPPAAPPNADGTAGSGPPRMTSFTVALSDGASSAVFARQWARLLVGDFASGPFPTAVTEVTKRVALLGRRWKEQVSGGRGGASLPWYAQEKLPQGSSASLLVVTWDLAGRRTFRAHAVGDSCLFVVRANTLRHVFPVARSDDFGTHPDLLSTEVGTRGRPTLPPFAGIERSFDPGDRFLLMTDALAQWFLSEYEAGNKPWDVLPTDDAAFRAWLKECRDGGRMKNDDVTLLTLSVVPAAA